MITIYYIFEFDEQDIVSCINVIQMFCDCWAGLGEEALKLKVPRNFPVYMFTSKHEMVNQSWGDAGPTS